MFFVFNLLIDRVYRTLKNYRVPPNLNATSYPIRGLDPLKFGKSSIIPSSIIGPSGTFQHEFVVMIFFESLHNRTLSTYFDVHVCSDFDGLELDATLPRRAMYQVY